MNPDRPAKLAAFVAGVGRQRLTLAQLAARTGWTRKCYREWRSRRKPRATISGRRWRIHGAGNFGPCSRRRRLKKSGCITSASRYRAASPGRRCESVTSLMRPRKYSEECWRDSKRRRAHLGKGFGARGRTHLGSLWRRWRNERSDRRRLSESGTGNAFTWTRSWNARALQPPSERTAGKSCNG